MKKTLLFIICLFSLTGFSQEDAWIFFNAKPNAQYYYDNPLQMLSQRSLDRRTTQNITLDIKDVPLHQPFIDQITNATGITVLAKSKWLNCLHIRGLQSDIVALSSLTFVDHIQYAKHSLNARMSVGYSNQLHNKWAESQVTYNYGNSNTQVQMLNVQTLHQQDFTGSGKIIAIMDAGFPGVNTTAPFQRLRDNGLILGGYDFVNNNTNPYTGYQHGTQVLSTMGGFVNNQLVGTAPDAKYYLFITEDIASETPLEESNWVEAAEMADYFGVDIINTSLGYFTYDDPAHSYTYSKMNGITSVISRATDIAFSRGMITVTSAGNSGNSSEPHISVPADAITTLTVGSVDSSRNRSSFSSIGPSFDGRLKPEVMALGSSSTVANQAGIVTTSSGTSFSSPIMAGAIASFWSAFPNKKNSEILNLVKQSSDIYNASNNQYGFGIPNFQDALNLALSIPKKIKYEFDLYPNPANSNFTLTIPESIIGSNIKIYNSLGQLVLEQNIKSAVQNISIQNLANGIYCYFIDNNEKNIFGKLIKN
jgi:serine protease AprX